jgi:hypothetical protein
MNLEVSWRLFFSSVLEFRHLNLILGFQLPLAASQKTKRINHGIHGLYGIFL